MCLCILTIFKLHNCETRVSRPGVFGGTRDTYDTSGKKVTTSRPGVFGGAHDIYDTNGNKTPTYKPGDYGDDG